MNWFGSVLLVFDLVLLSFGLGSCAIDLNPEPDPTSTSSANASLSESPNDHRVVEIRSIGLPQQQAVTLGRYQTKKRNPVLEEIEQRDGNWQERQSKKTSAIDAKHQQHNKRKKLEKKELVSSLSPNQRPPSVTSFVQIDHHPPVAQFYTGTCWSFAATSFVESEVRRLAKMNVKLSEMATVFHEYLYKAAGYLEQRSHSFLGEGSGTGALLRVFKEWGVWPHAAYAGTIGTDKRHDHIRLFREITELLRALGERDMWDTASGLDMVRVLLNRHLGTPPEKIEHQGEQMTPNSYLREVLKVNPDDYVHFVSTLSFPFYRRGELEVEDNWWHDNSYHNLPLQEFYQTLKGALTEGYSVVVAIDTSEPGKDSRNDVMFIPDYDLPPSQINQIAREYRFAHGVSTDDHAVHLVGYTQYSDHDWFLAKDSGRSAYHGQHKGYFFIRQDYVLLKVLAFTVHKEAAGEVLSKFQ